MKELLFRLLFGAEFERLKKAEALYASSVSNRAELARKIEDLEARRPARIENAAEMTEEQIAERLAGTENSPPVKAVLAKIGAKVIALSDQATDAPRGEIVTREGVIPAFTNDDRLHLAGGAAHLAELLRDLQALAKPRSVETPTEVAKA